MAFDHARAGLVIVDMQVGYTDPDNVRGAWMRRNDPAEHRYFFSRVAQAERHLALLLAGFRRVGRPVIHVTFGWHRMDRSDLDLAVHRTRPDWAENDQQLEPFRVGGAAHRIVDSLAPAPGEVVLNKTGHSAFSSTDIDTVLRSAGVSQIVIGGWATNACVELTARDAADRGFETFLVEDACASFSQESHDAAIVNFRRLYGAVVATQSLLASWE